MATKQKRVIVAPLAWGLGHATRCIPVVRELLKLHCKVWVVLTPEQQALYEPNFGNKIEYIPFDDVQINYSHYFAIAMLRQLPKLSAQIKRESSLAEWLAGKIQPDLIISDNRYGFRATGVKSVILSHQLQIRAGLLSAPVNAVVHSLLKRFDSIWVPDTAETPNLSGQLSHGRSPDHPIVYGGPLSRMREVPTSHARFDWLALLSGPEPERSKLENLLIEAANALQFNLAIVAGQPLSTSNPETADNITRYAHANDQTLMQLVANSSAIICRSGYSSLCDLAAMNRKALLIPTPGQTEQVYLAGHFKKEFGFRTLSQRNKKELYRALENPQQYSEQFEIVLKNNWHKVLKESLAH